MGVVSNKVRCGQCGETLTEPPGLAAQLRKPCPRCGSTTRGHAVTISRELKPVGRLRARAFSQGITKWFKETINGADWSRSLNKWVRKLRVIDRRGNHYKEKLIDPETGEVLRDIEEPLSEHTGRGSARDK